METEAIRGLGYAGVPRGTSSKNRPNGNEGIRLKANWCWLFLFQVGVYVRRFVIASLYKLKHFLEERLVDVARYLHDPLSHEVESSEETVEEMLRDQLPDWLDPGFRQGLGVRIADPASMGPLSGPRAAGHTEQ